LRENQKHKPKENKEVTFDINAHAVMLSGKNKGYQLLINVKIDDEDSENTPYNGEIQVVGIFSVAEDQESKDLSVMVHKKGTGILYSAVRELVLTLTGRGPWGPLMLPILDDLSEIKIEEIKDDASEE
ncbi:MAG: protein-export chaperone SecB, partial [Geopsychrobacter sp.]|nr:protein-export chaperone SecB [Geopsychrobacter sp.]